MIYEGASIAVKAKFLVPFGGAASVTHCGCKNTILHTQHGASQSLQDRSRTSQNIIPEEKLNSPRPPSSFSYLSFSFSLS